MKILTLNDISYSYEGNTKKVFEHLSYEFNEGNIYAIVGRSGAGKTTLLSLLSGLETPTEGTILFKEKDIRQIDRYLYRSKYVGIIFQSFNLLSHLTALENVILSMDVSGIKYPDKKAKAMELLAKVGLNEDEAKRRVLKLSGGQQQRVAIARALSYEPEVILADEPTGNLDQETENEIMKIFKNLASEGKCIIIVTHSQEVAQQADEIKELI
ncbi:ABC transporter [Anaerostipes sp. 494a]|uniref:ABC transporter ATP-binding protein n=1 Tax=Anaerostipes TaxID=207244 RepID=UPI000952A7D1|nr:MULTISPECIES: ABC transporter ATP-binding protein [Anaerostipes]MCI5622334.1 ABC transporter ATP-binding protein [Anaerostipes sp.]MDY2726017.1 ABC transporter ATP-binding protein [Anaerostipes faecalis]OLR58159.1 ABC transporter [Anaerostipes sp. 494a]OLR60276.1 ABC transporter [Anaerostipes sp. 494a]